MLQFQGRIRLRPPSVRKTYLHTLSINFAQGRPSVSKIKLDPLEHAKLDLAKANFTRLYQAYLIKSEKLSWGKNAPPNMYTTERNFRTRSADTIKRIWTTEFSTSDKFEFLSYGELEFLDNQKLPQVFRQKVFDYERRNTEKRGDVNKAQEMYHRRYINGFERTYTIDDFIRGEDFLASHADSETRVALAKAKATYRKILKSWCRDEVCENPEVDYKFGRRKFENFLERHWRKLSNQAKAQLYNMEFANEFRLDNLHWRGSSSMLSEGVLENIREIRLDHSYLGFKKWYNFHKEKKLPNDKRGGIEKSFNMLEDDDKIVFVEFSRTGTSNENMDRIFEEKFTPIMAKRVEEYRARAAKNPNLKKTAGPGRPRKNKSSKVEKIKS